MVVVYAYHDWYGVDSGNIIWHDHLDIGESLPVDDKKLWYKTSGRFVDKGGLTILQVKHNTWTFERHFGTSLNANCLLFTVNMTFDI